METTNDDRARNALTNIVDITNRELAAIIRKTYRSNAICECIASSDRGSMREDGKIDRRKVMKMIGSIIIVVVTAIIGFPVWDFRNGTGFSLPNTVFLIACIVVFNFVVDFIKKETTK